MKHLVFIFKKSQRAQQIICFIFLVSNYFPFTSMNTCEKENLKNLKHFVLGPQNGKIGFSRTNTVRSRVSPNFASKGNEAKRKRI